MGCDIHLFVEMKSKKLGKWLLYSHPEVRRDYDLFAKMANVRNYDNIEPLSDPKGLPDDISESVQLIYDYERPDAHSESYLTLMEINRLQKWHDGRKDVFDWYKQFGFFFGNDFDQTDVLDPPPIEDVRFVFWFDN